MTEPLGIKYPIQLGPNGFFEQTYTSIEEAKSNLYTLILTRRGERVMHPDFGTDIYSQLFNQIDGRIGQHIEQDIKSAVEMWLPYIELLDINVDASNENIDRNRIDIKIQFGLKRDIKQFDELVVTFVL